jgi:hypothetical protein
LACFLRFSRLGMGALRLTSRRWALPFRHHADAPYIQLVQNDRDAFGCQSSSVLTALACARFCGTQPPMPYSTTQWPAIEAQSPLAWWPYVTHINGHPLDAACAMQHSESQLSRDLLSCSRERQWGGSSEPAGIRHHHRWGCSRWTLPGAGASHKTNDC